MSWEWCELWELLFSLSPTELTSWTQDHHNLIPLTERGQQAEPEEEDSEMSIIYTLLPLLYGFLNSAPATINVVNVEIISIFWRQAVIYPSHFSGAGSHAVKSSDCQLSADWGSGCNLNRDLTTN